MFLGFFGITFGSGSCLDTCPTLVLAKNEAPATEAKLRLACVLRGNIPCIDKTIAKIVKDYKNL